jgi:hypothetical protein
MNYTLDPVMKCLYRKLDNNVEQSTTKKFQSVDVWGWRFVVEQEKIEKID